ncbi:MBG domain-containing protein [Flavobacterium piscisymbiosum]|uniref:T9SS type A sorting domain-containing protein n=1 Tax=Flavobacterium piscisymbiosum TaxID=2893753 RepID=A0ABS8MJW0_9FLAO|nr:MBG domain-containing protein [Flavobacterium sp. F-30]MCC9065764.1 T9SS type A sorting domain-containing protein [Flavobacterium sp. F-30]
MRRIILLLTIFSTLISNKAEAQPYYNFLHPSSPGIYSVGGINVGFNYNPNGGNVYIDQSCPSVLGYNATDGGYFTFGFNVPIAGVRIRGIRQTFNSNTNIDIKINEASYTLNSSNLSSFSACNFNAQGSISNGDLVGGNGMITITQSGITSLQVQNNGGDYWIFVVEILPLVTTANTPCAGSTLNLTSDFSGLTSGISYNWTGPNGFTSNQKNPSIGNITAASAGIYTVTASNGTVTAKQTQNAIINPIPDVNTVNDQTLCNGSLTNAVNFSSNTAPVTYTWANNNTTVGLAASGTGSLPAFTAVNNSSQPVTAVITVTPKYTSNGTSCEGTPKNFKITVNPSPAILSQPISTRVCANGNAAFSAIVSNVSTYHWQVNTGSGFVNVQNTAPYSGAFTSTLNITNASAAANGYQYRLIAAGTCGSVTSEEAVLNISTLSSNAVVDNVSCNGASDGSIIINPSGGISPYTFSWDGGSTAKEITGLISGTYKVTITDANLCSLTESFTITQPNAFTATQSQIDATCSTDGQAAVTAIGGTTPYTYLWSPSGATTAIATGLKAGNHSVLITDANGCTITKTYIITTTNTLVANASKTDVLCNGTSTGSATVVPSGAPGPFTYTWSPSGGNDAVANNLAAGNYSVTIKASGGCSIVKNFTIAEPSALKVEKSQTNVSCYNGNNGSASVIVTGGTGLYNYSWAPFGGNSNTTSGLTAGSYTVTITDTNNCSTTETVVISQPEKPVSLSTLAAANITIDSVLLSGIVSSDVNTDKGECLTEVGFVYAAHTNPSINDTKINITSALGTFTSSLSGLKGNKTYYVKTYAINSNGFINYGNEVSFTTEKYTLTITAASGHIKVYGTTDPVFNYTASGFENGDTNAIITGLLSRDSGENAGKYNIKLGTISAGADYTIVFTGAEFEITKANQTITWNQTLEFGCENADKVTLSATSSSELPVSYLITDPAIGSISGTDLQVINSGSASITAYQNGDQNHNPAPAVIKPIEVSQSGLITQQWEDVLFFNNKSANFISWQWYKNENPVSGATRQYYSESQPLNGSYYVISTDKEGKSIKSCPIEITGTSFTKKLKIYPNPARPLNQFTLECDFSESQLNGAQITIFDITGKLVQTISNVKTQNQITAPAQSAMYVIVLSLNNNQKKTINLLVK